MRYLGDFVKAPLGLDESGMEENIINCNCTITNVTNKFFYLFPYLLLPYMFQAFFMPIFKNHYVQIRQWF
jgi:hypothetical protein